jgi:predicted nuclease of restriction endonuclease-like (RecB) superfamily
MNEGFMEAQLLSSPPAGYNEWFKDLKERIRSAQQRAVLAVNSEMLALYWQIGRDILERQSAQGWGAKVVDRLAADLRREFPEMKGFSRANLLYMRALAEAWPDGAFVQQLVGQIPWGHNITLLTKVKDGAEREWYARAAIENGWSRAVLVHQIESRLFHRQGKAVTNFAKQLPALQSELAEQTLKDPYLFDFLGIGKEAHERDIENALVEHITRFLLELGAGFAYVGRQVHLEIGGEDFYLDLLFYHLKLRCYIVIELKAVAFKPEYAGKLNFYLSAVDAMMKHESDNPSIGLILCKDKNRLVAEYALKDISKPVGISEYRLIESIPEDLKGSLPSIEQIEAELSVDDKTDSGFNLNRKTNHS